MVSRVLRKQYKKCDIRSSPIKSLQAKGLLRWKVHLNIARMRSWIWGDHEVPDNLEKTTMLSYNLPGVSAPPERQHAESRDLNPQETYASSGSSHTPPFSLRAPAQTMGELKFS
jgi:hypothetical protein